MVIAPESPQSVFFKDLPRPWYIMYKQNQITNYIVFTLWLVPKPRSFAIPTVQKYFKLSNDMCLASGGVALSKTIIHLFTLSSGILNIYLHRDCSP